MINKSNAELCASLNFSFDEANELFCEESLLSLECAQISGKGMPNWGDELLMKTNFSSFDAFCIAWRRGRLTPYGTAGIINPTAATLPPDFYIEMGGDDIFKVFHGGTFFTWGLNSGFIDASPTIPPTSN